MCPPYFNIFLSSISTGHMLEKLALALSTASVTYVLVTLLFLTDIMIVMRFIDVTLVCIRTKQTRFLTCGFAGQSISAAIKCLIIMLLPQTFYL